MFIVLDKCHVPQITSQSWKQWHTSNRAGQSSLLLFSFIHGTGVCVDRPCVTCLRSLNDKCQNTVWWHTCPLLPVPSWGVSNIFTSCISQDLLVKEKSWKSYLICRGRSLVITDETGLLVMARVIALWKVLVYLSKSTYTMYRNSKLLLVAISIDSPLPALVNEYSLSGSSSHVKTCSCHSPTVSTISHESLLVDVAGRPVNGNGKR